MKVFILQTGDGDPIEAPQHYKNIFNFNKFPSLMRQHGFEEYIKVYSKSTGEIKYVTEDEYVTLKENYTELVYPGNDYYFNEETNNWEYKLEVIKEQKLSEIRNATNAYMKQLKKGFSDAEMETWSRQENGLKLLAADINSEEYDAVWVKNLAATRGISLEEQMQRIAYASNMMNEYAYRLVGYQQSLEDKINAATTAEEVQEIRFNIGQ